MVFPREWRPVVWFWSDRSSPAIWGHAGARCSEASQVKELWRLLINNHTLSACSATAVWCICIHAVARALFQTLGIDASDFPNRLQQSESPERETLQLRVPYNVATVAANDLLSWQTDLDEKPTLFF